MKKVTLIPGDGIGPEIAESVRRVVQAVAAGIQWEMVEAGIGAYERTGQLIPAELPLSLERTKIALKGPTTTPVGTGHLSINVAIRQKFNLYANVRPVLSLKGVRCRYDNVDLIIVRENSEGLYKGIEYMAGNDAAHTVKVITRSASERIARYTFQMAKRLGRKKVTVVHKANIMKLTDGLFLDSIRKVAKDFGDIQCNDMIVDNCCMQLVTRPEQFDIILTENLYGDMISDLGAGLIGGLGVAAGANIGDQLAIFEAVHGSAPDIAGKNTANPTAFLLSGVMMLEHMGLRDKAALIRSALLACLATEDEKTLDLGGRLGTKEFTDAIINRCTAK